MKTLFIEYPKCTTCQKAKKWLDDNGIIPENLLPSYSWLGLEVIGNIHDNPDLLEVGI